MDGVSSRSFEEPRYYTSDSRPFGLSYGEWTVKWWKWFLSIPKLNNPQINDPLAFSSGEQPGTGNVWFLAGKVGDENRTFPTRYCEVPPSHSILFPVINCEVNSLEYPELNERQKLIEHVTTDEDKIRIKKCMIDGNPVPALRVKSDPTTFEYYFDRYNPFGVPQGLTTLAADGYWVFLKPLTPGKHSIEFEASCENGRLNSGANYFLQIG